MIRTATIAASDTSSTGVKLSMVIPSGARVILKSALARAKVAGTPPTVRPELVRAGVTYHLATAAAVPVTEDRLMVALIPGDTIQWNVTAGGASSTTDFFLSVEDDR